jgi:hypothetical protein
MLLSLMLLLAAAPAGKTYTVSAGAVKGAVDVPKHELVTVTENPPGFVFYSIKAGYEQPDDGPYTNVPAEMSVRIVKGTLDEAMEQMKKNNVGDQRQIAKEINRDGQVIWLVKEKGETKGTRTNRGFQFVPGDGAVFVIDVTGTTLTGMPRAARGTINQLLLAGLKSVKVNGDPVATKELQEHVTLR